MKISNDPQSITTEKNNNCLYSEVTSLGELGGYTVWCCMEHAQQHIDKKNSKKGKKLRKSD
jgi:hypothetical protein